MKQASQVENQQHKQTNNHPASKGKEAKRNSVRNGKPRVRLKRKHGASFVESNLVVLMYFLNVKTAPMKNMLNLKDAGKYVCDFCKYAV